MRRMAMIFAAFLSFTVLAYMVTLYAIQWKVEGLIPTGAGVVNDTLLAAGYMSIGLTSYFVILNLSAIAGLVVYWKRRDRYAISTFKVIVLLTAGITAVLFLM